MSVGGWQKKEMEDIGEVQEKQPAVGDMQNAQGVRETVEYKRRR